MRRISIGFSIFGIICLAGIFWANRGRSSLRDGERALAKHDFQEAERCFRAVLAGESENRIAVDRLSYLLGLATRTWEAVPFQLAMLRQGDLAPRRLYILVLGDRMPTDPDVVEKAHQIRPHDPNVLLGWADLALRREDHSGAAAALREALQSNPGLLEARVKLGRVLLEASLAAVEAREEFHEWWANLPDNAYEHPGLWTVFGEWARARNQPRQAVRCLWEAVRRDANHQQANYQLGQLLMSLGDATRASPFLKRASKLEAYATTVYVLIARVEKTELTATDVRRAAEQSESLGLLWESLSWHRIAMRSDPPEDWVAEGIRRLMQQTTDMPLVRSLPEINPALQVDLSDYPLPTWPESTAAISSPEVVSSPPVQVKFEDRARASGLRFQYVNGGEPLRGLFRVYEFTGGGAAVIDYDGDGWPDIHFTQGGDSPAARSSQIDQLFRNRGNGSFQNVTKASGVAERGYSQGAAAGDFDNDGFADLYIANIGENRFYRNNGDGTFTDITRETSTGGNRWSTSCLLADLNGDGCPDLYVVNYLGGPDVFDRVCRDATGIRHSCLPQNFPAEQDQLYLNLGDGRFEEVTEIAGIVAPDGKGLGIVAADFDGSGKLNLFIANDAVPNFYFVNLTPDRGARPLFDERALITGLAFDADGRSKACMGVAAGDADGDGWIDLFVTNFTEEASTLYRQFPGHLFVDVTREAGLREPSLAMLGFGTQFIDGELDGRLDLIVTNGHVDDYRQAGIKYQMPPQYFRNLGEGRFTELPAKSLGPYFEGEYLGRGLARLDWNRDGREDVVISHLDAPAALLTNTTEGSGHVLVVRLRGVTSDRDAIGTTVTAQCGNRRLVRQLTAGDGYQASNERMLIFGLGTVDRVDDLEICWPSGERERLKDVPADRELLLIEGRAEPAVSYLSVLN